MSTVVHSMSGTNSERPAQRQRVRRSLERRNIHHVVAARLGLGECVLGVAQNAIAYTAQASVGRQTPLGQQFQSLGESKTSCARWIQHESTPSA